MRNILLTYLLFASGILVAQSVDSLLLDQFYQKIDSVKYTEVDFKKMQTYFKEKTDLYNLITKKVEQGDRNAIDFLEILSLSFEKANEKYGKEDIKIVIYGFYNAKATIEKFEKLHRDLDAELDSLQLQRDYYKDELHRDNKIIDFQKAIDKRKAQEEYLNTELRILTDLDDGIKKAQSEKKPILLYFTGYAVVNGRKIESDLILKNYNVFQIMKEDYINVWLYIDDKVNGKKWFDYQKEKFKSNVQPYFVILDSNGNPISKGLGYSEAKANLEKELLKNK